MASSPRLASSPPDPEENSSCALDAQLPASDVPTRPNLTSPDDSTKLSPGDTRIASEDIFAVLRRSIADESQPPDALIRATTEAAKVLTAADGVAIAFRSKGVILCRARSGDLAPDVGSYVNANAGISGECLRTASILVCHDARNDTRVDNLVCERMGVRSIVVVPLRGPVGISGILEVFSARGDAFGNREINCLRGLAEIAEAAYERERNIQQESIRAALRSAHRLPAVFQRPDADSESWGMPQDHSKLQSETSERPERLVWAVGVALVALLMILGVWLSWRGPISELTELEAAENPRAVQAAPKLKETLVPPKPTPAIVLMGNQHGHPNAAKKSSAGQFQPQADSAVLVLPGATPPSKAMTSTLPAKPPEVKISAPTNSNQVASLLASQESLPLMAAPVSRGVISGKLIRKVDPVYPPQAFAQRIAGPVVLEIGVSQDGMVGNITTVSGDPQLASAAVDAVRQWRYAPTVLDGHPIAITRQVTVIFKLP
jgi:TonB family protein